MSDESKGLWIMKHLVPDMQNVILDMVLVIQLDEWKSVLYSVNNQYHKVYKSVDDKYHTVELVGDERDQFWFNYRRRHNHIYNLKQAEYVAEIPKNY